MRARYQRKLDSENKRHERALVGIVHERIRRMTVWFKRRFPNHSLKLIFGNGTECVTVDDFDLDIDATIPILQRRDLSGWNTVQCREASCLQEIQQTIFDVREISGEYCDACPNDLLVKGRKRRRAKV